MKHYFSPTDMGVNMIFRGITNQKIATRAAKKEIIFYLFRYRQEYLKGLVDKKTLDKINYLLKKAKISEEDLPIVSMARKIKKKSTGSATAIELHNGQIVTGKNSALLHAEAACFLNAIKVLAKIPDSLDLLSAQVIESLNQIKDKILKEKTRSLELNEVLVALAISAPTNPTIKKAIEKIPDLKGCYFHSTQLLTPGDENILRKLGIWFSTEGEIE